MSERDSICAASEKPACSICDTRESEFRPVVGYEDVYSVSNIGRVMSTRRSLIMRQQRNMYGYAVVGLSNRGTQRQRSVHQLVLEAFHGTRPDWQIACHGRFGNACNCSTNLTWGTVKKNNYDDRLRDGTLPRGKASNVAVIDEGIVQKVRAYLMVRVPQHEIARRLGITRHVVSDIAIGRAWSWLSVPSRDELMALLPDGESRTLGVHKGQSRLMPSQILRIMSVRWRSPAHVVAKECGVSPSLIRGIWRGEVWKELTACYQPGEQSPQPQEKE